MSNFVLGNGACQSLREKVGKTVSHVKKIPSGHHHDFASRCRAGQRVPHCSEAL